MALLPGATVGPYRVTALLGRGGMSDVYHALDCRDGRAVAVKLVRSPDPEMARRMALEVRALERFSHPGLVRLLDSGVADGQAYLVMELVQGQTLGQRLAHGPLSPAETAHLGQGLASALAYVHSQGIVHRDVKPGNVLISPDGAAHLADFGIARLMDASTLTVAGTTLGTAAYMAPEQLEDHQVGPAADIWSLGAVLVECLLGRRLFEGSPTEVLARRMTGHTAVPVGLPPAWEGVVGRMLDHSPQARPPGAVVAEMLSGRVFASACWPSAEPSATAATAVLTAPHGGLWPGPASVQAAPAAWTATARATPGARWGVGGRSGRGTAGRGRRGRTGRLRLAAALTGTMCFMLAAGLTLVLWFPAAGGHAAGRAGTPSTTAAPGPLVGAAPKVASTAPLTSQARAPTSPAAALASPGATGGRAALARLLGTIGSAVTRGALGGQLGASLASLADKAVAAASGGNRALATTDVARAEAAVSQALASELVGHHQAGQLDRALGALGSTLGLAVNQAGPAKAGPGKGQVDAPGTGPPGGAHGNGQGRPPSPPGPTSSDAGD